MDVNKTKSTFAPIVNIFSHQVGTSQKIFFLLRLGILGCFVGHGSWGLIIKPGWLPFFDVFYIQNSTAYFLMPIIGIMDILIGIALFFWPNRALLLWAIFWTLFTALLRPSAGMGMSEFFERAGNYGVPIAFLFLYGFPQNKIQLKEALKPFLKKSEIKLEGFEFILRLSLFALLAGHGSLALFNLSPIIQNHLLYLGWHTTNIQLQALGLAEILLGVLVFLKPQAIKLMFFVLLWKVFWEILFPFAGSPIDILETIERMGDYVIPSLLIVLYKSFPKTQFKIFP